MPRLLLPCFLLTLALPVAAQDAPMTGTLPDAIVVTASRMEAAARETGRRVTVFTARDLADLPVSSFDELLRTVGGVEVQSRGGFGVQSDLTMRGSTFNGVLVLLDGARLNDPMTGHFLTDFPVPRSAIARIEVLRGPATALYGPDALGGVIQLFTFDGLQQAAPEAAAPAVRASVHGGSHRSYDADVQIRTQQADRAVSVAAAWQGTDGEAIRDANGVVVRGPDGPVRTDFERYAVSAAFVQALGEAVLFGRAGRDDRAFGAYHFYTGFASDTAREATTTNWAQLRLALPLAARTQAQVQAAYRDHEDRYVYHPQTPANEHTSQLFRLDAHLTHRLRPTLHLQAGADAHIRRIDSNNLGTHDAQAAGGFAGGRWQPRPTLTVNGSARLDYDAGFGWEATPHLSLAYNQPGFTLRGGVGRAVRAPNFIERYFNTTLANPRGRSVGNPNLEAERAWSYEVGLDLYLLPGLSLHATAFRRDTDHLIDYVLTPADTVFLARNLLDVQTTGLELDFDLRRDLGPARLALQASYTWLDADLRGFDPVNTYKYVLTNARHLVQTQASAAVGAATLGVQVLWKDPLETTRDAYAVTHLRAAYRLPFTPRPLRVTAEVRNVFDRRYSEVFDAPMPGRWWLFGLRWGG